MSRLRGACIAVVRYATAAILTGAAAAKFYGLITGQMTPTGLSIPVWMTACVVSLELLTAWALITLPYRRCTLLASAVLFSTFLAVGGYRQLANVGGCGCFGPLDVNPLVLLAVNAVLAISLWSAVYAGGLHEEMQETRLAIRQACVEWSAEQSVTLVFVFGCVLFVGTEAGRSLTGLPSVTRIIASTSDVGQGEAGTTVEGEVLITNTTDSEAQLKAANASCGCILIGELVGSIPPNSTSAIPFRLMRPEVVGRFEKVMRITVVHPDQLVVFADIIGQVEDP